MSLYSGRAYVITLELTETDTMNRSFLCSNDKQMGSMKSDHNKRKITLTMITLSYLYRKFIFS